MKFEINKIYWIGLLTLVGFPSLAFLLLLFFSEGWNSFLEMFTTQSGYTVEFVLGACFGSAAGMLAWIFIKSNWMRPILLKYGHMVQNLKLSVFKIIFLSICAGVGEEIFFRGALQPFFGIWITAIFFVAIHGYLNFKDIRIFVYGVFMTSVIAVFGWMTLEFGLLSAIIAHVLVDIVLFYKLTNTKILNKNCKIRIEAV